MPRRTKNVKITDRKKAWMRKSKPSAYQIETTEVNETILIVGEGLTEKLYFESFPVLTLTVHAVNLKGQSKLKLIEATESIVKNSTTIYNRIWCIFDMDINQGEKEFADFDNAINSGKAKGYEIGYSNDCFELWFYLHYNFTQQKNHRNFYYDFLGKKWGCNYKKEGKSYKFCLTIYSKLIQDEEASQEDAINRAEKLYNDQSDLEYHNQNPITTSYKLVQYLNENSRR